MKASLDELARVQATFSDGYVGFHFFVTRWRSDSFAEIPDLRRRVIDRLVEQQRVAIILTDDGVQAIRVKR